MLNKANPDCPKDKLQLKSYTINKICLFLIMGHILVFPLLKIGQNIVIIYLELTAHCSGKSRKKFARLFLFFQTQKKKFECS